MRTFLYCTHKRIRSLRNVSISLLVIYIVSGFVFEGRRSLEDLSHMISDASIFLQENNRFSNVLISESGQRAFLLQRVCTRNAKPSEQTLNNVHYLEVDYSPT